MSQTLLYLMDIYISPTTFNQHDGCHKAPSYGFPGGKGGYCYSHKTPSMTYLKVMCDLFLPKPKLGFKCCAVELEHNSDDDKILNYVVFLYTILFHTHTHTIFMRISLFFDV